MSFVEIALIINIVASMATFYFARSSFKEINERQKSEAWPCKIKGRHACYYVNNKCNLYKTHFISFITLSGSFIAKNSNEAKNRPNNNVKICDLKMPWYKA